MMSVMSTKKKATRRKTNIESEPWGMGADLEKVDARWISLFFFFFVVQFGLGANQKRKKNSQQTYIHTYIVSCIPRFTQKKKALDFDSIGHTHTPRTDEGCVDTENEQDILRPHNSHHPSNLRARQKERMLSKQQSMSNPSASHSMSVLSFSRKSITSIHLWTAYILV